jgi:hypothetical protein
MSVPSSELGPPRQRVCLPPWTPSGEERHFLGGEGVGGHIRTTEKKAWHSVYSLLGTQMSREGVLIEVWNRMPRHGCH